MEPSAVFNYLAGIVMTVMGWFLRELWEGHKSLRKDMNDLTFRLSTNFATKEEIKEVKDLISGCETRVEGRINHTESLILKRIDDLGNSIHGTYTSLLSRIDTKADK